MPRDTDAEIFIRTLTELWEEECARKKARLRAQLRHSVQRFIDGLPAGTPAPAQRGTPARPRLRRIGGA